MEEIRELTLEECNELYDDLLDEVRLDPKKLPMLAKLALKDLFFLLTRILNRDDANRKWIFERTREVEANPNGYVDMWAREHYKALDINTPILTISGWKLHGNLISGDIVFAPSGEPVEVIANTGEQYDSDCYAVDGVVAAGNHLWPVLEPTRKRVPGTEKRNVTYKKVKTETRALDSSRLPNISSVMLPDRELLIDPYILGYWLGDGHSAGSRITTGDDEVWDLFNWDDIRDQSVEITKNLAGLTKFLRKLNVLNNKHIPEEYLFSGKTQRLELLQGLMDSDGHVNTRGTATFVNTNEYLVDGVYFLANSLGMRAHKRDYDTFWQVSFQAYTHLCPFKIKRKADRCKSGVQTMRHYTAVPVESVTVNCIQVEGGEYLAGKELLPTCNSTVITFALNIQEILKNPNVTICIFSHTRPIAKAFLYQIRKEFEDNILLQGLFPDILYKTPKTESPRWSLDNGIEVKRTTNHREATVEAWGLIDGQPISKHFDILNYDDVVTEASITTPEMIDKTTKAWELSVALGKEGGYKRYIGTRYHFNDTYNIIMSRKAGIPRIYPATDNGEEDGVPVLFGADYLEERRRDMGIYTYACQMLQNPTADKAQGFKLDWLKYWRVKNTDAFNLYLVVDPAGSKGKKNDYTVMLIIGLAEDKNYYVIDGIRDRMNLTERTNKLIEFHRRYNPIAVGYEKFGKDGDIEHIESVQEDMNYNFDITPLYSNVPKDVRIKGLVPKFETGRVYWPVSLPFTDYENKPQDLTKQFRDEEYLAFPVPFHDDILDDLANILNPQLGAEFPVFSFDNGAHAGQETADDNYEMFGRG